MKVHLIVLRQLPPHLAVCVADENDATSLVRVHCGPEPVNAFAVCNLHTARAMTGSRRIAEMCAKADAMCAAEGS